MKRSGDFSKFRAKLFWLTFCAGTIFFAPIRGAAQSPEHAAGVKRVVLDWAEGGKGSNAVRDRLAEKLKALGKVEIVQDRAKVDAVLHGSAVLWTTGYVAMSPRSRAAEEPIYQGYATAELTALDGKTLWSYLATPRHQGWKSITDDLADQLASALSEALAQKEPRERTPEATTGPATASIVVKLHGAGGTFPAPIYQRWFQSFEQARPGITVEYDAVGSAQGIARVQAGQVDFGASDMPLPETQLQNEKLLQIATVLGAVVPIYNVQGAPDGLNLSGEVLAGIFEGKIRTWDAPEIHALNRHVRLPNENIVVVHRSDGSGTTYTWTDYLSKVSHDWKTSVGIGPTVAWPTGLGARGNQGVADTVFKTPNSIGYVEFIYALQHELSFAAVRNASGDYVKADLDSVAAAARGVSMAAGKEFQTSLTNAGGKHTYPIATFTWILLPTSGQNAKTLEALQELVRWMLTNGQKQCQALGYVPLPADLAARELQRLNGK
ncbi:MAG TPA: phosphate ABC transporter substrate-binding protein PstS [Candidatus Sulfotelmatobacter sp.]|nr:phosphate ABC transporter substrate-binding protein PstS [Candidatus Sulfotelmatobacter sp.]